MNRDFIKAVKGPFIAAAVFAGFEFGLSLVLPRHLAESGRVRYYPLNTVPNIEASVIQWKTYDLFNAKPRSYGAVFLGDSSCLMGVIPEIIKKDAGLSALNLGTIGWLYTDGYADLLNLYLRRFGPPRVLVYHISDYVLETPWTTIRRQDNLRRFAVWSGEYVGSPLADRLPSARAWYLIKYEASRLLGLARPGVLADRRGPFPSDAELRKMLEATRGYMDDPRKLKISAADARPPRWNSDCVPGLKKVLDLSRKYSFPVVVVMNPLPRSLRSPAMDAAYLNLETHLERVLAPYPNARLGLSFPRYYPDSLFGGGINHLSRSGAVRNSGEIAGYLLRMGIRPKR